MCTLFSWSLRLLGMGTSILLFVVSPLSKNKTNNMKEGRKKGQNANLKIQQCFQRFIAHFHIFLNSIKSHQSCEEFCHGWIENSKIILSNGKFPEPMKNKSLYCHLLQENYKVTMETKKGEKGDNGKNRISICFL